MRLPAVVRAFRCRPLRGGLGERREVTTSPGGGEVRTCDIVATRNGRPVVIGTGRCIVSSVSEVTRSGTPPRAARFMETRFLGLVDTQLPTRARPSRSEPRPIGGSS